MERVGGDRDRKQNHHRHPYPHPQPHSNHFVNVIPPGAARLPHGNPEHSLIPQTVLDRGTDRSAALALAKLSNNSNHNHSPNKRYLSGTNSSTTIISTTPIPEDSKSPNRSVIYNHKHLQYIPPPKRSPSSNLIGIGSSSPTMTNGRSTHVQHSQLYPPTTAAGGTSASRSISTGQVSHEQRSGSSGGPLTKSVGVGANLNFTRTRQQSIRGGGSHSQPSLHSLSHGTNSSESFFFNISDYYIIRSADDWAFLCFRAMEKVFKKF